MNETIESEGTCLCSTVKIRAKSMSKEIGVCHCDMCRKWAGAPFMGVDCQSEITIEGKESVTVFDASEWAERGFCSKCGTHLFYHFKAQNQYVVPVGLFTQVENLELHHEIFIDSKPDFYDFANETQKMTGEEVFAMFMSEGS